MRKYIIGAVFGFILSIGVGAHAEVVNMIGKVVDGTFAVKVGDATLDTQAITIEGTSYLPVRAIGDAIGYNVGFDANTGITLTKKADAPVPTLQKTQKSDPVADSLKSSLSLKIKSSSLNVPNDESYQLVTIDSNEYVQIRVLGNYARFENPNAIFEFPNSEKISVNVRNEYQTNIDGFQYDGTSYVKLSAIGLKGTVSGDTLTIDKQ